MIYFPYEGVDLRSDTITQPTPAMREVIAGAAVGDDVFGDDPSVFELQRRAAELMGKEAALFVPSGTMANLLGVMAQTQPGESIVVAENAHIILYEGGSICAVGGVLPRVVPCEFGLLSGGDVRARAEVKDDAHFARTALVSIENTVNRGGGAVYDLARLDEVGQAARELGLKAHCDGARIFNAAVALGAPAVRLAAHADTVSFCLSKGLGCPVGSLIAGPEEVIKRAHRMRKRLGGGMRQAGVLAAAGLYALEHHIDRLGEDHARARRFREALEGVCGMAFPMPSPTNIVYIETANAPEFAGRLAARRVRVLATGADMLRAVFHLHITDEDVERAVEAFVGVAGEMGRS